MTALLSIPIASYWSIERLALIYFSFAQQDHKLNGTGIIRFIAWFGITTLSTIAMVVYPLIVSYLDLPDDLAGVFIGGFASNEYTTTIETFYRIQLAENLAITPNLQYIIDPHTGEENATLIAASIDVIRFV